MPISVYTINALAIVEYFELKQNIIYYTSLVLLTTNMNMYLLNQQIHFYISIASQRTKECATISHIVFRCTSNMAQANHRGLSNAIPDVWDLHAFQPL